MDCNIILNEYKKPNFTEVDIDENNSVIPKNNPELLDGGQVWNMVYSWFRYCIIGKIHTPLTLL